MSGDTQSAPGVEVARAAQPRFGITSVEVRGFRTARDVAFSAGPLCALVGEADAGKSNLLAAIRAVLDPAAAPVTADDAAVGGDGRISIRVELAGGAELALDGTAGASAATERDAAPAVVFLPADARGSALLPEAARGDDDARVEIFRRAFGRGPRRRPAVRCLWLMHWSPAVRTASAASSS